MRIFNLVLLLALCIAANPAWAAGATVLAFGDSLTAGYGLAQNHGFVAQLERHLRDQGHDIAVRNAGVSGDTTAGGLARLDWTLAEPADLLLVELGANDALRGIDPATTEKNLDAILAKAKGRGLTVLLAGMRAPPNMGRDYAGQYEGLFERLADKHDVALYPFFLDGVAARPELNQGDGIHPNARGVAVIVERIAPYVLRALEQR